MSLLKIDVEGMELNVLKGAEILLRASSYPPIMVEAWDVEWFKEQRSELLVYVEGMCIVPCDYIPIRSWSFFLATAYLQEHYQAAKRDIRA